MSEVKEWEVFVDHETIRYTVTAETKEEAERIALEKNGEHKMVDVCNVEAWEVDIGE